eukprot:467223-Hanusia_phi.AAC.1
MNRLYHELAFLVSKEGSWPAREEKSHANLLTFVYRSVRILVTGTASDPGPGPPSRSRCDTAASR